MVITRFAPSPTGLLHVGNARVALINWLLARRDGGRFLLRYDDSDATRSKEAYATAIADDLRWMGLGWDDELRQVERHALHEAALERLKADGRVYACYETPEELERKRSRARLAGRPPRYDRTGLKLTDADRRALEAEGRRPHWRFRLDDQVEAWEDMTRGRQEVDAESLSDPVLVREDGTILYTLASVADDSDLKVTHVVRGEDHVANTAVQIQIFRALGAEPPQFAHLALLLGPDGEQLSKRTGGLSVEELRSQGAEPLALASLLATLGTGRPQELAGSLDELAQSLDLSKMGRAAARFDLNLLQRLTSAELQQLSFEDAWPRLVELGLDDVDAPFWEAVRSNLERFSDIAIWHRIVRLPIKPVVTDQSLLSRAADRLPPEPWTSATWKEWTRDISAETGLKGRDLFMPLRLALTGQGEGPPLQTLLPLLGRERVAARLAGEAA